ncbi:MAG: delta-60 repeat domain-containing protein [Candidatus Korobacteraceae bacterium]
MKNATLLTITGLLAIGLMFGVNLAQAQNVGKPGTLDPKFGTDGTVTTIFTGAGSPVMLPIGAVQQASGDIVVLSQFDFVADEGTQIGLTRYTAAGQLDKTFGTQGSTITNFSSFTFDPFAFALEPNGKILVAGFVSGGANFGLAQFTANGVLDTTFGTDGVAAAVTGADFPNAFLLQPNGQILMGGFKDGGKKSPGSLSLVRFNSNGALDTTFGTAGISLVTPAPILGPEALALLANGDYLAVGENGNGRAGTVVELSSTGELLSGVIAGTLTASSPLAGLEPFPTIFESNGDYLVAQPHCEGGSDCGGTDTKVQLFGETGVLNSGFSSTPFGFGGFHNTPQALAVQSNGQVVVGDLVADASGPIFGGIARLDTNGELDTTFGSGGTLTVDNNVTALLIDTNGDILAIEGTGNDGIVVAAYLAN